MGERPQNDGNMEEMAASALSDTSITAPANSEVIEYAHPQTPTASGESFGTRSARGGMIMTLMNIGSAVINFSSQIILAWLLLPKTFGTVAVVVSISSLVAVLRDAGAPTILIQRQHEFNRIAGSVFWLNLMAAGVCALIVAICAPIIAHTRQAPILLPLLLLTAIRFPIGALGTVSATRLVIDLRWGAMAAATFLQPLVTASLAIVMAWRGMGVYSLVVPPIAGDAVRGLVAWIAARVHVPLRLDWGIIAAIVGASAYIVLTNLTLAVRGFGDYLTLSFTQGERDTGLYYYAFTMSVALSRLALGALPSVLAPVFSKVRHDQFRHAEIVTRALHTFAAIGVLPIVMQGVLAWPLFRLFLAAKWFESAPIFAIISLMILCCFLNNVLFQAMWASGFYKQFFWYSILFTPAMVVLFIIGSHIAGMFGVAWANVIAAAADFVIFPVLALRLLKVPWRPAIAPLWRTLVAAIPTVVTALLAYRLLPTTKTGDVLRIVLVGLIGTAGYAGILLLIWRPVVTTAAGHFMRAFGMTRK